MTVFIRYAASIDSMGDATDAERAAFLVAATAELMTHYPGGDIELTQADYYGCSTLEYQDCDPCEVRYIIERLWDDGFVTVA